MDRLLEDYLLPELSLVSAQFLCLWPRRLREETSIPRRALTLSIWSSGCLDFFRKEVRVEPAKEGLGSKVIWLTSERQPFRFL